MDMVIGPNQFYTRQLLPGYLLDPSGLPYFDTSGIMKDRLNSSAIDAVEAGFIQTAPIDALDKLGVNKFIDRSQIFTDDQWRAKLAQAWTFWQTSGTPARLIQEITELGYVGVSIIPQWIEFPSGVFTKNLPIIDPNAYMNVTPDPSGQGWWSNFYIVLAQPHGFSVRKWGSPQAGVWRDGDLPLGPYKWGAVYGDQQKLATLIALIRKLKPAWTSCRGLVLLTSTAHVWGDHNWGTGGVTWGFLPAGSYIVQNILEDWETRGV